MPTGKTVNQLPSIPEVDITDSDQMMLWDTETGTARKASAGNFTSKVAGDLQGYFSMLSNFYFDGGLPTSTVVAVEDIDTWITPAFVPQPDPAGGTYDYRPSPMKSAESVPFDLTTMQLSLAGLTLSSFVIFRSSMSFTPDEDGGQMDVRLLFQRHVGATPSEDFPIQDVAFAMTQGADVEYAGEPSLTFFIGDTLDQGPSGDSGYTKFQFRSSVPGTFNMRALSWYITQ
tara:strand:+ start:677 stop:1366 length:690 start_codon:yes stop_codon:yes gene_type:complete